VKLQGCCGTNGYATSVTLGPGYTLVLVDQRVKDPLQIKQSKHDELHGARWAPTSYKWGELTPEIVGL